MSSSSLRKDSSSDRSVDTADSRRWCRVFSRRSASSVGRLHLHRPPAPNITGRPRALHHVPRIRGEWTVGRLVPWITRIPHSHLSDSQAAGRLRDPIWGIRKEL